MGRPRLHRFSREQLVCEARLIGEHLSETLLGFPISVRRLPSVPPESNGLTLPQDPSQPAKLVISQGIHGIQQQGPHSRFAKPPPFLQKRVDDRHKKALGFAAAGAGRNNEIPTPDHCLANGDLLMVIERPLQRQLRRVKG